VSNARVKVVVGAFAAARVAIGVAFAVVPRHRGDGTAPTRDAVLMTRSFAVREVVLGVGGLLAVARADRDPAGLRRWAGLGALTDTGDLWASLAGARSDAAGTRVPALVAAAGLACELWAVRAASLDRVAFSWVSPNPLKEVTSAVDG
jgi:hypothetical protein